MPQRKNIILFIGQIGLYSIQAVRELEKHTGKKFRIALLMSKNAKWRYPEVKQHVDMVLEADMKSHKSLDKALEEIKEEVAVVNCRMAMYMPVYAKIISSFPQLRMPSKDSIEWCSNKLMMRRKFRRYAPKISPKFASVHGATKADVEKVKKTVGFPCVVKPASLAASTLVSICYHPEELQATLRRTFRGIKAIYKKHKAMPEPEVIVEQFMEGLMYSIDSYVDGVGNVKHLPAVFVKTGQDIGVDDFFNYRVITPTRLSTEEEAKAQDVGDKAVKALGLRSCSVHMEFIKLEDGWKVLEVDARMGGHRDFLYRSAFGIPHGMNDLLVRMNEKPVMRKKLKHHACSFNIFPKKKGIIKSIKGLKKVRALKSLKELIIVKKVGDKAGLSKQGYSKVLDVSFANASREELFADMRRMEQAVDIEVGK